MPKPEQIAGLLDRALVIRQAPNPEFLLGDPVGITAWKAGVDTLLDELVPALKKISMMSATSNHGPNCIHKPDVEAIIGRVPLTRTAKGWE
jgi:hypothetical protein